MKIQKKSPTIFLHGTIQRTRSWADEYIVLCALQSSFLDCGRKSCVSNSVVFYCNKSADIRPMGVVPQDSLCLSRASWIWKRLALLRSYEKNLVLGWIYLRTFSTSWSKSVFSTSFLAKLKSLFDIYFLPFRREINT